MVYSEALAFLSSLQMFGARPGLERMNRLAQLAGHPEQRLRFIHVAGTNGKGSTCAMLEAIYRASGRRTGLYTSPHLVSFRERIQVNRELIPETEVVRLTERIRSWLGEFAPEDHPTFFEVVTLMALEYFAQHGCELVIWETGLGGRLDATNIVTPLASVITNVQFDHEKWLGHRLEDIAREKAGIIKPRVPVITSARARLVLNVLRAQAVASEAPFHEVYERSEHAVVGLEGGHQQLNAALAVKTVEVLGGVFPVAEEAIRHGLKKVRWPGRFQVIRRGSHTIILDGAHNPDGAIALVATLCASSRNPVTLIVGVLEDKDVPRLCEIFGKVASRVITVPVANSRTAGPRMLADIFRTNRPEISVTTANSLSEAFAQARNDECVVISGSLYLIGEALELLGEIPASGERALNEWSARPV